MKKRVFEEVFMSLEEVTQPRTGYVLTDRWWVYKEGEGTLFVKMPGSRYLTPQCNKDKRISKSLQEELYPDYEVKFLPVAFVGHVIDHG